MKLVFPITLFALQLGLVAPFGGMGGDYDGYKPAKEECPKIDDFFKLKEENIFGELLRANGKSAIKDDGSYSPKAGDTDIWSKNPLFAKKKHGDYEEIGTSEGNCILLPPIDNDSIFNCLTTFNIGDFGSIMMMGPSPSDTSKVGHYAIVGGTKCFEGASGTVQVAAADDFSTYFYTFL